MCGGGAAILPGHCSDQMAKRRRSLISKWGASGKPEAYRHVRRRSRASPPSVAE
jgi:hypothetical protein